MVTSAAALLVEPLNVSSCTLWDAAAGAAGPWQGAGELGCLAAAAPTAVPTYQCACPLSGCAHLIVLSYLINRILVNPLLVCLCPPVQFLWGVHPWQRPV